ncbi:WG containing repeat-containing protein [Paenibacillus sp. 1_12]|uniref:WG repeat-containing protein n=1 Tax=Paenibacillus sp. 1_12 TaxID=1566278 RepID=UPI0008EF57E7|nr:WG repeat-containing protein [Paenibacillus sp. 1_12]SFM15223.1 WG containing repeat-containing protein [Paenibacillus sp. 1_12]
MMMNETQTDQLNRAYAAQAAQSLTVDMNSPRPVSIAIDLDGDGYPELAYANSLNGENGITMLKQVGKEWRTFAHLKGPGYAVSLLTAAPVTSRDRNNLIVGWQIGSIWSKLSVYEWTADGFKDVAPPDMDYSYLDIEDMPGQNGRDGLSELALWIHDTGEAYKVEVLRWHNGEFTNAWDVYPYYFHRVVRYYEALTRKHPDYAFYWYYLADAQYKAGMPHAAALSLDKAISLKPSYPSPDMLNQLQQLIQHEQSQQASDMRATPLYSSSQQTIHGMEWGYINDRGDWVIRPQYEYAADFQSNGYAVVQIKGQSGIIDLTGEQVVPPVWDSISSYTEGRAIVIDKQGFKVINENGQILTDKAYSYIAPYSNERAAFATINPNNQGNQRYGYLDLQGHEVIAPQYEEAGDFHAGKAVVKLKKKSFGLIDRNGALLFSYPYADVGALGDGLLPFQKELSGKYGYINERGKIIISPQYTTAMSFEDKRAIVNTSEDYTSQYGLIDRDANFVIKPEYNFIRTLGEQRVAIGKAIDPKRPYLGSKYAIADLNGKRLSEFVYTDVSEFKNGLASVTDGDHTYFIDPGGKAAPGFPRLEGSGTLVWMKPLIQANIDQRLSYLDRNGHVVWQQNTVIPLRPPYRVKELKYKPNKDYLVYYPQIEGMSAHTAQTQVNEKLKQLSQVKPIPADTQLDYSYSGNFNVSFFRKNLLQLQLIGYNFPFGAAHGMPTKLYTPINLMNGRIYELKDLFKPNSDYVAVLSEIVGQQIKQDPQYSYVFPDTYKGIKADQPFYVSENALHLYFYPYDIAPYVAGFPTFNIPFSSIMNLIAVNGEFWRAFH